MASKLQHRIVMGIGLLLFLTCSLVAQPESPPWSERLAGGFMLMFPDTIKYPEAARAGWSYERGVVLQGIYFVYRKTGNSRYLDYIRNHVDQFVREDGSIGTYRFETFNLDNIATGRQLLQLYSHTGAEKYRGAADLLRRQLKVHPRTREGGFWHKQIYPSQMWLDGLYMAGPFSAEYASMFQDPEMFDDIADQFFWMESHTYDAETGLLAHAWDESREQRWADPVTGRSPSFWGRAMGWYAWALVDVLDFFPTEHPRRDSLIVLLQKFAEAIVRYREPESGLWYQVVDQGLREGNYLESSSSSMFVYVLAKGARMGYLDPSFRLIAERSFRGILDSMITVDTLGIVSIHQACSVGGLGGNPYRDGSFAYYVREKKRTNDFKAIGPFILASLEMEKPFQQQAKETR